MLLKVFFLAFIHTSLQLSSPSSPTYDAAVVEFNFARGMNSVTITETYLKEYIKLMQDINPKPDIMVFPEMTLNLMLTAVEIPEVEDKISPCNDDNYKEGNLVKILSCSAITNGFYLVVNIVTKAKCPDAEMLENGDPRDCKNGSNGFSYYNTNVVFDRSGTIISRYRKYNLFGERVDKPYKPQMATFSTDFGVTFGHFICFDLMFRHPAVELVRTMNVTDVIFPTMWFSELPFLTAVQAQQNWAHSLDVNLLGAGANFPAIGSTGSGIYGGKKGAYVVEMSESNITKVLTATVHKKIPANSNVVIEKDLNGNSKEIMKGLKLKRDQLDLYEFSFLEDMDGELSGTMNHCRDEFCCSIRASYKIANSATKKHYQYALVFNHGKRTFDGFADGGVVACAVIACQTKEIASCGIRDESLENIHIWEKIEISGKFSTKNGQFLYMPTSVDTSIIPLQPEQFIYSVENKENQDEIIMKLDEHAPNLLSFGIYGRDFNLDNKSAASIGISNSLITIATLILASLLNLF